MGVDVLPPHSQTTNNPLSDSFVFTVEKQYGLVIVAALTLLFECFLFGMFIVGAYRRRVFNKHYMKSEFGQVHKEVTGTDIGLGGYPDMGEGMYAQRLDYNSWLILNKAQRIHQNFLEVLVISVVLLLIGGWQFPITSAILGFVHAFGRLLSISYVSSKGASHVLRQLSSFLSSSTIVASCVLSFIVAIRIINH